MGRSRILHTLVPLAATLAMIAGGCAQPAPTTPPTASPSAGTPEPGASAPTDPNASAPAGPTAAPSAAPVMTTTLRGRVFDDERRPAPSGTQVSVRSLDPAAPFETTVQTADGTYVVNGAPVGKQLEITATREGWTRRVRVEVLEPNEQNLERRNLVNFGGPSDDRDPAGRAYYISDYPEIESVKPVDDEGSLPADKLTFSFTLSEPLDAVNQGRLAAAFTIIPNNSEALSDNSALPQETATSGELDDLRAGADPTRDPAYRFRQNSSFAEGLAISNFTWSEDGRTATFSMEAPIKTGTTAEAQYAFLLVHQDDEVITDRSSRPLGMNADGEFGNYSEGDIIRNAIKETEVSVERPNGDADERWQDTHVSYTTFSVMTDTTAPTVTGVVARRGFSDTTGSYDRIEVTFSEPMVAFPAIRSNQLLSLNNYVFTAAATQSEVDGRTLTSSNANDIGGGASATVAREAISSTNGAVLGANGATMDGGYSIALSPRDPKVVILRLPAGALPLDAQFVKIYAGSDAGAPQTAGRTIADPAGNLIPDSGARATGRIF